MQRCILHGHTLIYNYIYIYVCLCARISVFIHKQRYVGIRMDCVSKNICGVTPGLLHSESTVYNRAYHMTLCQNHLIMLFSFPTLAVSMYAGLDVT